MKELLAVAPLIPGMLGLYALAFIAGGIYYLEQRVARIRDQFPRQGPLAFLTGVAALGIGVLAALSIGGYLLRGDPDFRLGALASTLAGVAFWIFHIYVDWSLTSFLRDILLAVICAVLALLTGWWTLGP